MSIAFTLSAIFIPKIRLSFDVKNSPSALYAADTGIEWCLYIERKADLSLPIMTNGAEITINDQSPPIPSDCVFPVRSLGTYQRIIRALEVSL